MSAKTTKRWARVIDRAPDGKVKRVETSDEFTFDASKRRFTDERFMVVPDCKINRTGIQEYGAFELGIEGTNRTVRMLRLPEEVFAADTLASFERQTLTNSHPTGNVNADNFTSVTVGDVHDVVKASDGIHTEATLTFKARDSIELVVVYGKDQLSCGYSFEPDMTPGIWEGQAYDGVMRSIRGNHVAQVWAARGGPNLRVSDEKRNRTQENAMHTVIINGIKCEVADGTPASSISTIEREVKALTDARDAAITAHGELKTKLEAATGALDEANKAKAAAEQKLKDAEARVPSAAAIDSLVEERAAVTADATKLVGKDADFKGKTLAQIRLAAVEHAVASDEDAKAVAAKMLKGIEMAKATPDAVGYAFDALVLAADGAGQRHDVDDSARAFAPEARDSRRGNKEWTGEEIFAYRQTHDGKNPPGIGGAA